MRFILIRHAQSLANLDPKILQGIPDFTVPLSPAGEDQAIIAGQKLAAFLGNSPVMFWISPYQRTRQTAARIATQLDSAQILGQIENPLLAEQNYGLFDGHPKTEWEEIDAHAAKRYKLFKQYGGELWAVPPAGESKIQLLLRVTTALHDIKAHARANGIETVAIVAHGHSLEALCLALLRKPYEEFYIADVKNCSLREIILDDRETAHDKGFIFDGFPKGHKKLSDRHAPPPP